MDHEIKISGPSTSKQRFIVVDGYTLGSISRAEKTPTHMAHWVGGIKTPNGEYWRVSEMTLPMVRTRIEEALKSV